MSRYLLQSARIDASSLSGIAHGLLIGVLIIVLLYVGREILEPLVIAGLLAFILSPLIRRLRQWGVWRVPSVLLTVAIALGILSALGGIIAVQITQLAEALPTYDTNLRAKVRALGGDNLTSGALERATGTLKDLQQEINKTDQPPSDRARRPILVEVHQPEPRGLETIANLVRPLLSPLAMTGLVVLFLLFILLQREDIRDRFLRLAGTADLQRSTAALDDAGSRLSRFFLMQTALNVGFGAVIGTGLALIGVPNPVLWGIFAGLMRFVPFIGGIIAAFFPVALAAAVDPGWGMAISTAALFLIAEPIAGQLVEPVLYGQHTGLSPVAVVISTLFWTLLWGPIGLLLATPLTVCLVVMGRHINALKFIEVLLGDEPALKPEERFYQRLLVGDDTEAADQAEQQLKDKPLSAYYDAVPMRALQLAQGDAAHGKLPREQQLRIRDTMSEVIEDLRHAPPDPGGESTAVLDEPLAQAAEHAHPILCLATRTPLDEAAALMLAHLLQQQGFAAILQPAPELESARLLPPNALEAPLVCLSCFGAEANPASLRYLIRRLRRAMPRARYLACFWTPAAQPEQTESWRLAVGANLVATSLQEAVAVCIAEVEQRPTAPRVPVAGAAGAASVTDDR